MAGSNLNCLPSGAVIVSVSGFEVESRGENECGDEFVRGEARVRARIRVVAAREVSIEGSHDRVLLSLLHILPTQIIRQL